MRGVVWKPQVGALLNPAHPPARGLQLGLLMNENSGDRVWDASGNGNHATITGASWGSGPAGSALLFDGSDYVAAPAVDCRTWPGLTVLARVYWDGSSADYQGFVSNLVWGQASWRVELNPWTQALRCYVFAESNSQKGGATDAVMPSAQWAWVGMVWDKANIYGVVNGVRSTAIAASGDWDSTVCGTPVYVGSNSATPDRPLHGAVSDVLLFSKALADDETREVITNPYAMFEPQGPPAWWWGAMGAGEALTAILADAGSGSDALTVQLGALATLADAGAGSDAILSAYAAIATLVDAGVGRDGQARARFTVDYTEVDTNGWLAVTGDRITATAMQNESAAYVYRDLGVGGITGDFVHQLETTCSAISSDDSWGGVWGLANMVSGYFFGDSNTLNWARVSGTPRLFLTGDGLFDFSVALAYDTPYYVTIERICPTTLRAYIYSDAARTVLVDTLTPPLADGIPFRYLYAAYNYDQNQPTQTISFTVANLEIRAPGFFEAKYAAAVTLADAATGADAVSAIAGLIVELEDAGAGSDALGALLGALVALQDNGVASDALTAALGFTVALADSGTGSDQVGAVLAAAVTLADAATAADSLTALRHAIVSLADAGVGADTMIAGMIVALTIRDTVTVAELRRIGSACWGSYFERPDADCATGYNEDAGQDDNLYQEMV